jgi:hypothetical protein
MQNDLSAFDYAVNFFAVNVRLYALAAYLEGGLHRACAIVLAS